MKFDVYGPYEIPRLKEGRSDRVDEKGLSKFWDDVSKDVERRGRISGGLGLDSGCGCYVFATQGSGGNVPTPWYVGLAEKRAFANEVFADGKIKKYNSVLNNAWRAVPKLFFLPKLTAKGDRFTKPTTQKDGIWSIQNLETLLIDMAIHANPKLLNKRDTKKHQIEVVGFRNTDRLAKSGPAKDLRMVLDIK